MPASLLATGLGGLYMSTIPSFGGLYVLFGFWGASTILAFWAPLIRATREWGGEEEQGRAFGILDGGRGLAAALLAAIAAYAFGMMVGGNASVDPARETSAMRTLLCSYAGCCFFAAVCVWFFVPDPKPVASRAVDDQTNRSGGCLAPPLPCAAIARRLAAGGGHYRRIQYVQDVRLLRLVLRGRVRPDASRVREGSRVPQFPACRGGFGGRLDRRPVPGSVALRPALLWPADRGVCGVPLRAAAVTSWFG